MGLFSSRRSNQDAAVLPQYTGLQLQTATNTLPVPLCYGLTKLATNIVYYANFTAIPIFSAQKRAGKGGLGSAIFGGGSKLQIVGWFYEADLILALCEGPIVGIGQVWQGQSTWLYGAGSPNPSNYTLGVNALGTSLYKGAAGQQPWGHLAAQYQIAYPGLAYLAAPAFNLGQSASIGTLALEVAGLFYGSGANGIDADPALVIDDFCTNAKHGAGFEALDRASLLGASGDSSFQTYCRALGLCFSPTLNQAEPASGVLTRWLDLLNAAPVWTGGALKIVPYGDETIIGPSATWVAPVAPVYDLTDDDFIASDGEDPVLVSRIDPLALPTVQRIEVLNRAGVNVAAALAFEQYSETVTAISHLGGGSLPTPPAPQGQPQYQATPVEARDLGAIQTVGLRVASTTTAHEICDLGVGATVAQIKLQRGLYMRAHYKFRLDWTYCLLDPMDVVTLTDPGLGLEKKPVRIVEIEEDENGYLQITAEDLTIGVSTPGPNATAGAVGAQNNASVPAAPVDSLLIYEPPALLAGGAAQIWFGASGGAGGIADPNWGGCYVWASIDNGVTYAQIGKISAPLPQGVLTAPLAQASGWDTTSILSLDMRESGAALSSTTQDNAKAGVANLALIGSELLGVATMTLTGVETYNGAGLARGLFGTTAAAHATGAQFALLANLLKLDLDPQYVGRLIKFQFQSFNIYGEAVQDLATCQTFDYTPNGNGYAGTRQFGSASQVVAFASGATQAVSAIQIPQNAYLLGVTVAANCSGPTHIAIDPQTNASGDPGGVSGAFGSCAAVGSNDYETAATLWKTASAIVLTADAPVQSGGATVTIKYLTVG